MLIQVTYTDNSFDYVKDFMLDALIESGSITKFKRSSGWVVIGSDPIRHATREEVYSGVERRHPDERRVMQRRIAERRGAGRPSEDRRNSERRSS